MKRIGCVFLILLSILTAALVFYRLQVSSMLFSYLLDLAGMKGSQVEVNQFGRKGLHLSRLDLALPDGGQVSLQGADLSWNRSTLAERQVQAVSIDTLTLTLADNQVSEPGKRISIPDLINRVQNLRKLFPFQDLYITHLVVHGRKAGPLDGKQLGLAIKNSGARFTGELFLTDQDLRLSLDASKQDQWDLYLRHSGQSEHLLAATVNLKDDVMRINMGADMERLAYLDSLFNFSLPELKGNLAGKFSLSLNSQMATHLELELQGAVVGKYRADLLRLAVHGRRQATDNFIFTENSLTVAGLEGNNVSIAALGSVFNAVIQRTEKHWQASVNIDTGTSIRGIKRADLRIGSVLLGSGIKFIVNGKNVAVHLEPQWQARVNDVLAGSLNVAEATLVSRQETELLLQPDHNYSWKVSPSTWQLTTGVFEVQKQKIHPAPVEFELRQLDGSLKDWHLQGRLGSESLEIQTARNRLSLRSVSTELSAEAGKLKGTVTCTPERVLGTLAMDFEHDLKKGQGKGVVNTEAPLVFSDNTPLSSLISPWSLPGDLTGGQLQVQGSLNWKVGRPPRASVQINLSEGKGFVREARFTGLSTRQNLQILPEIQSHSKGEVTIADLNNGIVLHDISTTLNLAPSPHGRIPLITLENTTASVFGGTIHDALLTVDPQQPEIQNAISLRDIDLARLITLHKVKGLAVEGRISGTLPFQLDRSGLQMKAGELQNTPPGGTIRYNPPGKNDLDDSSLTGYALKALEEFYFKLLTATVQYTADGNLRIIIHLEGRSPKLETNRPVHLNITTEQNVLSLLKSLRYSNALTNEIDKKVQQHYQKRVP